MQFKVASLFSFVSIVAAASGFPSGYFFISSAVDGKVLDVEFGSTEAGAQVILYDRKTTDNDNQLWQSFDNSYYVQNKHSGLYLTAQAPNATTGGVGSIKQDVKSDASSPQQQWLYVADLEILPVLVGGCALNDNSGRAAVDTSCDSDDQRYRWAIIPV